MKTITEPIINRRIFFEIASAGVAGYFLSPLDVLAQAGTTYQKPAVVMNSARYAIFILLAGAPSHVDTFDLKVSTWLGAPASRIKMAYLALFMTTAGFW